MFLRGPQLLVMKRKYNFSIELKREERERERNERNGRK